MELSMEQKIKVMIPAYMEHAGVSYEEAESAIREILELAAIEDERHA